MATATTVPDDFGSGGRGLSPNANSPTLVEILKDHEEQINEGITADLSDVAPLAVGAASAGVATEASRDDHVHAHGNQLGGALHADATGVAAGFMPAAQFAARLQVKTLALEFNNAALLAESGDGVEVAISVGTALPAGAIIVARRIKIITPFAGAGVASLALDLGGSDDDALVAAYNIFGLAAGEYSGPDGASTTGAYGGQQLVATLDPDGAAGVDELTAGSAQIDVYYFVAP